MYQRDISWEAYLKANNARFADGSLVRDAQPALKLAESATLVASPAEIETLLARGMRAASLPVDARTVTPEELRAQFDWSMGSALWQIELQRPAFQELADGMRSQHGLSAQEARDRAERAYLDGHYPAALAAFQPLEMSDPADFALHFTVGHLHLYHQHPAGLAEAFTAYLKAAQAAVSRSAVHASRAYLYAAFVAYLQRNDLSAVDLAGQALIQSPQSSEAWYLQARLAACQGDEETALPALEQAMRTDRNYALRAAADPDFIPAAAGLKRFFEAMRLQANQQADTLSRNIQAELTRSPLPASEQPNIQRLQAEIAERWKQNTTFGYLDAAAKLMRFRFYLQGLDLSDRDEVVDEIRQKLPAFKAEIDSAEIPATLRARLDALVAPAEREVAAPDNLAQSKTALQELERAQALWQQANQDACLNGHNAEVNRLAFHPSGRWLVSSGSWDRLLLLWDALTGEVVQQLAGHDEIVNAACFTGDGSLLVTGGGHYKGQDFAIRLWDALEGHSVTVLSAHSNQVNDLAINPAGTLLASASSDQSVRLWSLPQGEPLQQLSGHQAAVACVAFSPDGLLLASAGEDQNIRLWDAASGEPAGLLLGHDAPIKQLLFTPAGDTLVSVADDNTLRLWDVAGRQLRQVVEGSGRITAAAMNPRAAQLAWAAGDDHLVSLWALSAGEPPQALRGHRGRVSALAFSHDGLLLASASEDGSLRAWDVQSGKCRAIFSGHTDRVGALAFAPDGSRLASGSKDKSVRLWGLVFTPADAEAVAADEREREQAEAQARAEIEAAAERQRQQWRAEGRCEVCGTRLGLFDKLGKQTRCAEHRDQSVKA